jgi:hypothetical protein
MPRKRLSTSCPRPVNSAVTKPLPLRNRPMTAAVDPADPSPGVGSTIMNRRSLCRKRPRSPRARDHADHHRVLRPCWAGRHPETGMIVHDQQSGTHHRISCLPDRPASVHTLTKGAPDLGTVRASPSGCAPRRVPGSAGAPRFDPPPECLASPLSAADQRTGDKTMDTDPAGTPMKPTARQRNHHRRSGRPGGKSRRPRERHGSGLRGVSWSRSAPQRSGLQADPGTIHPATISPSPLEGLRPTRPGHS